MEITEFSLPVQAALQKMNIHTLSEVQSTIPEAEAGRDLIVQAPTGAGKTLAYLLPIVERLSPQGKGKHWPAALILVPTRELALQTADTARKLLSTQEGIRTAVLTGGADMNAQVRSFSKGADIVIATPARLCDHLRRHTFKPKLCRTFVLDEADEMLSMGFVEDVRTAAASLPEHQTLLYSATMPEDVKALSGDLQKDPKTFIFTHSTVLEQKTAVHGLLVREDDKPDALLSVLRREQTLIFCNTIRTADFAASFLQKKGIAAEALHSGMDPKVRKHTAEDFRKGKLKILCATDVACRGIDIPSVQCVISYDYPDQDISLIHRIGRTSRAGTEGHAWIFFTPKQKEKIETAESRFSEQFDLRRFRPSMKRRSHPHR